MPEKCVTESAPDSEKIYWNWIEVDYNDVVLVGNIRPIDNETVEELASSISENGQLQPCLGDTIFNDSGDPRIRLIAGQHRYHAIGLLCSEGISTKIIIRVANRTLTSEEVLSIQMSENLQNKMTPEQDAVIIHTYWQRFKEIYGDITIKSLSRKLGRSTRKISEAIKYIEELCPKVQEMVDRKVLPYSTALLLSRLKKDTDDNGYISEQTREAVFIVSQRFNSSQAKKYLDRKRNEEEYSEPLFSGEVWESLKKSGYRIAIKDKSSKEGRQATGWFVKMVKMVSLLDNPAKVEFSDAIKRAVDELDVSLETFSSNLVEMGVELEA